jgi:hypothetical protein
MAGLKAEGTLRRRCRHRPVQYLNNILEQDHRAIKRRVTAKQSFREFRAAGRTIAGYEAMHMIRKGQARWISSEASISCSIWLLEHLPPTSARGLSRHRFQTCNTSHDGARTRVRCFDGEVHLVRESPVKIRALLRAEIHTLSSALDRLYADVR